MRMAFSLLAVAVLLRAQGTLSAAEDSQAGLVKPTSVEKVVADGKHNAFTALVRWKDQYWLAFRKGPSHAYGEADIYVLRSSDGHEWSEAHRVNALPDDRDPEFIATDERLFLYDPALEGPKLTSFVTYTDDGRKWSAPQPVYEPRFIFWKPIKHGDRFYATAHRKDDSDSGAKSREVHLITSTDGLKWEKISLMRAGNWESETTIYFPEEDRCVAFLRQKYPSGHGFILEAKAPYQEWTQRDAPVHFSGHAVVEMDGVNYLFSRTMGGGKTGTMIYIVKNGDITPYCELPSGGDCSYPGAVKIGDEMLVSYYSTHEGSTNVYVARVPLAK